MSNEVASFKPYKVQKVFRKLKKTGGKKKKRITIKKKKTRKTLKKPLFKRNKVWNKNINDLYFYKII